MSDPAKITLPPGVAMQPVESSHHAAHGHDPANNQLYIDFAKPGKPPSIYRYDGFSPEKYAEYVASESKGRHFLAHIKGKFPYTKLEN